MAGTADPWPDAGVVPTDRTLDDSLEQAVLDEPSSTSGAVNLDDRI